MWLRRTKSKIRVHNAPSHNFACSSFKDIHILLSDDDETAAHGGDTLNSPTNKPSICHRIRSVKSLTQSQSHPTFLQQNEQQPPDPEIRIPGADKTIVIYFTSLRVVRRTFEDCKAVRSILRAFRVSVDERDLSMDSRFMDELQRILAPQSEKSKLTLPRVFIGGRYVGGVEEVRRLHESGELKKYVEELPAAEPGTCEACGGHRFVLCQECSGSHKCYSDKGGGFRSCTSCNENGLIRCPSCSSAPL
ncbi:hypothetical protein BUALT_Bualt13G0095400 [Buddleja alternifolia]|uniref:Glutaredoxin domain-containing protein n=1 Tax=Buddleja alternifolia TaxID=168488 RepID=A0AAV6WX33_9LAMI|nr:hypothetical protein BUALT_Bualt13G0095400 [Buddleja alternifolia]